MTPQDLKQTDSMDTRHEKIIIDAPLKGYWKFLCPLGHHPDAFDFVKTDSSNKKTHSKNIGYFLFNKILSKDYFCWEEAIYSPIDGEVFLLAGDWPDHEYTNLWKTLKIWYNATYKFRPKKEEGVLDIRPNAGNHIMIKSDEGYIVFLAHLKENSLTVKQGQRVAKGQKIGLVGNSGNSTAPHLHINLFDQMDDPFSANVLPFVFNSYQISKAQNQWQAENLSVPSVGSVVKF